MLETIAATETAPAAFMALKAAMGRRECYVYACMHSYVCMYVCVYIYIYKRNCACSICCLEGCHGQT